MRMTDPTLIAIAGFLVQCLVLVATGTWKLSRVEASIRKAINLSRKEIDDKIDQMRREIDGELDRARREAGETGAALREKVAQVELFCRDTYVRRDSFYKVADEFRADVKSMRENIEAHLVRLEEKIDARAPARRIP